MKKLITYLTCLLLPLLSNAQIVTDMFLAAKNDTIQSGYLKRKQELTVRLPKSYNYSGLKYPVIFYLDAQDEALERLILANIDILMYVREIPEAILIGIPHSHGRSDLSIERVSEDTTAFLRFMINELVPYVNKQYRTEKFRTFIGHSLGGQFLTYGMTLYPEVFNSVIAISPALNYPATESWYKRKTLKAMEQFLHSKHNNHYYFCIGDAGFQDNSFKAGAMELDSILSSQKASGLHWRFDLLRGFTHGSTPAAGISSGLISIYQYWPFKETRAYEILFLHKGQALQEILTHEERIKNIYGIELPLPKSVYWQFGKYCLENGQYEDAIQLFDKNIAIDPYNSTLVSLKGDAFAKLGKKEEATKCYERSIALLKTSESKDELERKIKALSQQK